MLEVGGCVGVRRGAGGGGGGAFLAKELNTQLELNHDNNYFWKSKTC